MSPNPANPPYVLGLDVGTQSLRAALVDPQDGRTVAFGVAPIDTTYPRPAWAEQDANQWWSSAQKAVREVLRKGGIGPEQVAGVGLDCTACTVLPCDEAGHPLRAA